MRSLKAALALAVLLLSACATRAPERPAPVAGPAPAEEKDGPPTPEDIPDDMANLPDAVPIPEDLSPYGNPPSYTVFGKTYYVLNSAEGFSERGGASWYGRKFHGRRTSSGELYDMFKMTAAHKTLPLPSYLRVTNPTNGKSVIVRVNDRGPFHKGRVVDLSYAAAAKLDMLHGVGQVEVEAITPGATPSPTPYHPATVEQGAHYLQVAAFSNPGNAAAMRETLSQIGIGQIQVRDASVNGRELHRVLIGPLANEERIADTRSRLAKHGLAANPVVE